LNGERPAHRHRATGRARGSRARWWCWRCCWWSTSYAGSGGAGPRGV